MSVCTFLASNSPLPEVAALIEYPLHINLDESTIDDGSMDDNFYLHTFQDVQNYTDKQYGVWLEWNYTEGRAQKLLDYIQTALKHSDIIELWHVWLMDYYEYDERPVIQKQTIPFSDLTIDKIKEIDSAQIWNRPDKRNPDRPSFYCLILSK